MALPDEQNEQARLQWRARVLRERLSLSASVEEALAEMPSSEDQSDEITQSNALILPKLSLQSKPMNIVSSTSLLQHSLVVEIPSLQPEISTGTEASNIPQNPGRFHRLAQKLTTSLASIGAAFKLPEAMPVTVATEEKEPALESTGSATDAFDMAALWNTNERSGVTTAMQPIPSDFPQIAAGSVQSKSIPKSRLAGHPTKVRLQSASTEDEYQPEKGEATSTGTTSAYLPVLHATEEWESASLSTRGALSGSCQFESGQSEVVIANPHIALSSVVTVMLSGDPGPVVVKYISLQPQKGFTVHLSSPASRPTPFNYVVLLGELF